MNEVGRIVELERQIESLTRALIISNADVERLEAEAAALHHRVGNAEARVVAMRNGMMRLCKASREDEEKRDEGRSTP